MEFEINNAHINMVEFSTIEVELKNGDILEFETFEYPGDGYFQKIDYATRQSVELAEKINFKITEDFKEDLYTKFGEYSNNNR